MVVLFSKPISRGVGQPYLAGVFCMVSYLVILWGYQHYKSSQKYVIICLILTCLCLHLLSGSTTNLLRLNLPSFVIWLVLVDKKKQLIITSVAAVCLGSVLNGYEYSPSALTRHKSSNLTHLTCRPEIWKPGVILG